MLYYAMLCYAVPCYARLPFFKQDCPRGLAVTCRAVVVVFVVVVVVGVVIVSFVVVVTNEALPAASHADECKATLTQPVLPLNGGAESV